MKRRKRLFPPLLCLLILLSVLPCQAAAVSTSAVSAVLMDADSGRVLYSQNADARMRVASTTKLMTALVAIRRADLGMVCTVGRDAAGVEGSSMYLKAGEKLTLETLLYGLLLSSGNDAAVAIADAVAGDVPHFVALMNETAAELGMTNSSFANPNGLDAEGHYSTALDMAKLGRAAAADPTLLRIASTRSVTIGGRTLTNHNKLLRYRTDCVGLKTGYTRAAGRTLVSCAERDGQRLIAVTLQDGNDWADHSALFDYGFSAYPAKTVVARGEILGYARAEGQDIPLRAGESFRWPTSAEETVTVKASFPDTLADAPLGAEVGEAVITCRGKEVGRVPLLCGRSVPPRLPSAADWLHILEKEG